jgi:hypothetical protein
MESFFGTLKSECVDLTCFQTRAEARQTIFEYVEWSASITGSGDIPRLSMSARLLLNNSTVNPHVWGLHKSGSISGRPYPNSRLF